LGYKKAGKDSSLIPCPLIIYALILQAFILHALILYPLILHADTNARIDQGR